MDLPRQRKQTAHYSYNDGEPDEASQKSSKSHLTVSKGKGQLQYILMAVLLING